MNKTASLLITLAAVGCVNLGDPLPVASPTATARHAPLGGASAQLAEAAPAREAQPERAATQVTAKATTTVDATPAPSSEQIVWQEIGKVAPVSHDRGERDAHVQPASGRALAVTPPKVAVAPVHTAIPRDDGIVSPAAPAPLVTDSALDADAMIAMAMANHPAIRQAEAAVCAAQGVRLQVGLLPNPTIGYMGQEMGNGGAGGQQGVFYSQTYVRGDKLAWNRVVHSHDLSRMQWQLQTQRQRLETDVRIRFFRALTAQRKADRAREFRQDANRAVQLAEQRLEAEEGSRPDLLQSQILVNQIDLTIKSTELEWEAAWAELAATVGLPSLAPSRLAGTLAMTEELSELRPSDSTDLLNQIAASSPLLKAADARRCRAVANLQCQINQVVPNLQGQFGVAFDDSTNSTIANVQVGMTMPWQNKNQGNIMAARAELSAAENNLQRLRLLMQRQLADVVRRRETAVATIKQYQQSILPKARESLGLVEQAYTAGETEFLRVLTARQSLFQLLQQSITAEGDLAMVEAEIEGLLLSDGLDNPVDYDGDDGLRGQALGGQ
ncbi:MAG: TolC family protein [Planctomycetales bacterium]|nr:TolC family protein [Planctomycetales bacterium]